MSLTSQRRLVCSLMVRRTLAMLFRLGVLPWHQGAGSPVPHKSLSLVSRRLHAGRHSDSRQASSELRPRPTTGAWFRRRLFAFDTSATVHLRSSYQQSPDGFTSAFSATLTTPAIVPKQLTVV